MTGFKSGASDDDPLGSNDTDAEEDNESPEITDSSSVSRSGSTRETDAAPAESSATKTELPWIFDRSSITDGREKTVQLHLQQSTLDAQRQAKSDVESELSETVKKADLREAAIIVGLGQIDDLTDILTEWGYGR